MSEELKPCPFCGSDELSHGWSSPGYDGTMHTGHIECHNCGALIVAGTEAEAIAAWNTRAAQSDLLALVGEAVGRLEEASKALPVLKTMLKTARLGKGADVAARMLEANDATLAKLRGDA